jgi:hypothetical protein
MMKKQAALGALLLTLFALAPLQAAWAQAPEKPIATLQGKKPGARVELLSLKRDMDGMVTLRLAYVNDGPGPVRGEDIPGVNNLTHGGNFFLVDYANKKKYLIVTDSSSNCLCTTNSIAPAWPFEHGRKVVWAKFPAPPDSVTRIAVLIGSEEPIDNVPITQ